MLSAMQSLVEVDGSFGEGGGQVLRTALALSVITGRQTRIYNIRAGRKNPGLAAQHLTGVLAAAAICGASVRGAEIGSTEVFFSPGARGVGGSSYEFDVTEAVGRRSAGSATLVLQTIFLPLVLSGRAVGLRLRGGTHVAWSPPFDYFSDVFLPTLSRMGVDAGCSLDAWGFYPVGGGEVSVRVAGSRSPWDARGAAESIAAGVHAGNPSVATGRRIHPLRLVDRGEIVCVTGRAVVANLSKEIADRMARRASDILGEKGIDTEISSLRVGGKSTGAGVFLTARYAQSVAGFSALGKKGLPAERVALEACRELFAFHKTGAAVDAHLADQLMLPMSLAAGRSEMTIERVTSHLVTSAHVIRRFLPAVIDIVGEEGEPGNVVVEGAGE
jgi:RNA 3'-terminal phosphate cyclase (ATP)